MTLDHKTSLECQFFEIEIYTSPESFPLMYGLLGSDNIWPRYNYLRMPKKSNTEKIAFKFVKMKFLAMHISNQKLSFYIFRVRNVLNIFTEHDLYLIS